MTLNCQNLFEIMMQTIADFPGTYPAKDFYFQKKPTIGTGKVLPTKNCLPKWVSQKVRKRLVPVLGPTLSGHSQKWLW